MKKAISTLFCHQKWKSIRLLFLMFLFLWTNLSMQYANAQIVTPFSSERDTVTSTTLTSCSGQPTASSTQFTDDSTIDGLYADSRARMDTTEICPVDAKSYVKIITREFDLEIGDTLFAYDGNKAAFIDGKAPLIGTGAGVGVSRGYGGWIDADCDSKVNPSGCLTFIFKTDGDNNKGKGFGFWVDCAERDVTLGPVTIQSVKLAIDDPAYGLITIPAPVVQGCDKVFPTMSDSVRLLVRNQFGTVFIDTILTNQGAFNAITDTFAIGNYAAEYTLLSDPWKQLTVPFSVQGPALVCNDNVIIPMGTGCMIQINPDDLLEHTVDTITDTMYYNLTITLGSGKNKVVKTTTNFDNSGVVSYPIITMDDVRNAGMDICSATATVKIERLYYQLGGTNTIIHNGVQNTACETIINFRDQSAPFINVANDIDTLVACDTTGLINLISAIAIDNCHNNIPVNLRVELEETDPCFNDDGNKNVTTAKLIFSATDDCGNTGETTREVTIIRPNMIDHIVRPLDMTLDCREESFVGTMPGLSIGTIHNGVFTAKDTIALNTEDYTCGYILTSNDIDIPTADCGRKMYRYWKILDWCTPELGPISIDTQFIKYTDTLAPVFDTISGNMLMLEISPFACNYDITNLPEPTATDNCSTPSIRLDAVFRIEDGQPWRVDPTLYTQLEADSFHIRWVAEDECHEQLVNDTLMQLVIIKDVTRPTAICTDRLNISVGANHSVIMAEDVDAGSYDACGIMKKEISRDGITFDSIVIFSCDDIKDTVQITLRVTDVNGNTNSCWVNVHPEDKIRPICTPFATGISFANGELRGNTANVRINCNESKFAAIQDKESPTAAELASIGGELPSPKDNCPDATNRELTPIVLALDVCGQNVYQRRWVAVDIWGLQSIDTCFQTISVDLVEDWKITFPEDITMTCPMREAVLDSVILKNGNCDRLAVNVETKMFDVVQDACFKIVKTYHIINWCNYQSGDTPTHNFNSSTLPAGNMLTAVDIPNLSYITYTQILKVDDQEGPIVVLGEVDSCLYGKHDGAGEVSAESNSCGDIRTFTASATDCVTDVGGVLNYSYKIYRGNLVDVQAGRGVVVDQSEETTLGNTAIVLAEVEPGTYTAEFLFSDNCGNTTAQRKEYTFKDCTKPTPYLLNGIAIEVNQNTGMIDIWANDFNQGSYDNCTFKDDLDFRIWNVSLGFNPPTTAQGVLDSLPSSITFGCPQIGTQIVQIYVIDENNNYDYASTYVLVQDNMNACGEGPEEDMVAGNITNQSGEQIEGVTIHVNGEIQLDTVTQANGHFGFLLPSSSDYTVTPEKNEDPLNGISTFDLVLISKHILGLSTFDSPYKYIAADINKSGSITAFDMVQLRQLILNVSSEFPNNSSWRFLDKNYVFSSDNPSAENFAEFININNLRENHMNTDFIGVKIGDINGNAQVSNLLVNESRETVNTFNFKVEDQVIKVGDEVSVPFRFSVDESFEGLQFTLNFAGLMLKKVEEGIAKEANLNTNLADRGVLLTSWHGTATASKARLFTLNFTATTNGLLSDLLEINSEYVKAESYTEEGELMKVGIEFTDLESENDFALGQNTPNPFKDETVIGFNLPEAGIATLKILDIQGKTLHHIRGYYQQGYNQVRLNVTSIGATGVLYYQLETANHTANKKMIIIE